MNKKKLVSIIIVVVAAAALAIWSFKKDGAPKFSSEEYGIMTGSAAYLAYDRIASTKSDEFKAKVAALWKEIEGVETVEQLVEVADPISKSFDEILASEGLSEAEKSVLLSMKVRVVEKIEKLATEKLEEKQEVIDFLVGLRKGIEQMITLNKVEVPAVPAAEKTEEKVEK